MCGFLITTPLLLEQNPMTLAMSHAAAPNTAPAGPQKPVAVQSAPMAAAALTALTNLFVQYADRWTSTPHQRK